MLESTGGRGGGGQDGSTVPCRDQHFLLKEHSLQVVWRQLALHRPSLIFVSDFEHSFPLQALFHSPDEAVHLVVRLALIDIFFVRFHRVHVQFDSDAHAVSQSSEPVLDIYLAIL
jgi:hypothetical protein